MPALVGADAAETAARFQRCDVLVNGRRTDSDAGRKFSLRDIRIRTHQLQNLAPGCQGNTDSNPSRQ